MGCELWIDANGGRNEFKKREPMMKLKNTMWHICRIMWKLEIKRVFLLHFWLFSHSHWPAVRFLFLFCAKKNQTWFWGSIWYLTLEWIELTIAIDWMIIINEHKSCFVLWLSDRIDEWNLLPGNATETIYNFSLFCNFHSFFRLLLAFTIWICIISKLCTLSFIHADE